MIVQLAPHTITKLLRPVRGKGGFQTLLRRLQPRISGNTVDLEPTDLERLERYSTRYGKGGFQNRTRTAAADAQQSQA